MKIILPAVLLLATASSFAKNYADIPTCIHDTVRNIRKTFKS